MRNAGIGCSKVLAMAAIASAMTTPPVTAAEPQAQGELLATERIVQFTGPATNWVPAQVGLKLSVQDRLRTLELSRATLRLAELGRLRVNELTTLEILPPKTATNKAVLDLKSGAIYFFTREKPREFLLQTPYAIGASRGTEFLATVEPSGRTVLTVFDGEVDFSNPQGSITLTNGEQGTVLPGQAPVKSPVIQAKSIVQWWLYYPGVLDPDELPLTPAEHASLATSLTAYRRGDLRAALDAYPAGRTTRSDAETTYYAALLLSVGQVDKSKALLHTVTNALPHVTALEEVIATITAGTLPADPPPQLATEWLAYSYMQQRTNLSAALESAHAATRASPAFGFAWERVAELEFSFGHLGPAKKALEKALALSPRNAQAQALHGFILSAENRINLAIAAFNQAIETDPALGNAWLGRGLCRIREGDSAGGRADLQTAATLESNRSLLRSYLAKAFSNVYDQHHAGQELFLAKNLDTNDPTPWLYSALLNQQENRLNEGVDDLEESLRLNDNRRVYRSELLLDQDRAVRSASLATIYDNNGMEQVAAHEAARAVSADYGNYSAHLFLANSLDALRDPTLFNLRYETAWLNELLLANLLAPVGGSSLSHSISQQEYSKLFEANRLGLVSDSSWRSDGQFYELASQFGTFGNTSYALDLEYRNNDGVRTNNALRYTSGTATIKQQVTPADSLYFQATFFDYHAGDNFQYYDPQASLRPDYKIDEQHLPTIVAGYHREWAPGVHTLLLATRLQADQQAQDNNAHLYFYTPGDQNDLHPGTNDLGTFPFNVRYRNELDGYSAELNQIAQTEKQTFVFGARFQSGRISAHDTLTTVDPGSQPYFSTDHVVNEDFDRITGYAYYTLTLPTHLLLTGGVAYDEVSYPLNYQSVPVTPGTGTQREIGPKAALVWNPVPEFTLRGAYARSLGGISIDQSFRLEPVQLAGFDQSFRDIMPLVGAGAVTAPRFEVFGAAADFKFKSRTYFGIQAETRNSEADKTFGLYSANSDGENPVIPMRQRFDYQEQLLTANFNQLIGKEWSVGLVYQFTHSDLKTSFPDIPAPATLRAYPDTNTIANLHQLTPYILFNHHSGFFARAEAQWYWQQNSGYSTPLPGDNFVQLNCYLGYRLPRQYGELTVGLLNLTGTDYHLNPLNPYSELPRERVCSVRLRLSF